MKVRSIELDGYNQFKGVKIDITYPKGHEKAGKPLEKVCIIGQSGTGKTSILRLIKWFTTLDNRIAKNLTILEPKNDSIKMELELFGYEWKLTTKNGNLTFLKTNLENDPTNFKEFKFQRDRLKENIIPLLINYPAEIINTYNLLSKESELFETGENIDYNNEVNSSQIIDYALEEDEKVFKFILNKISEHRAEEIIYKNKISNEALKVNSKLEDIEKANNTYREWLKKNPNPLEKLANNVLNELLEPLGLKVKTDLDKSAVLHIKNIEIQTLNGIDVPFHLLSTGTKRLINIFSPLHETQPMDAIIMIDEPESSLYPDIQSKIVKKCVSLGTDCQYFFATHSPIIASSFDPWEIVELKFNEENTHIYQEQYYTGERHIDNYKFNPKYMSWDSILNEVFDIEGDGNPERQLKINELAKINQRITKKKQKESKETLLKDVNYLKDVEQFKVLANQLKWNLGSLEI